MTSGNRLIEAYMYHKSLLSYQLFCFLHMIEHKCTDLTRHRSHVHCAITQCAPIYDFGREKKTQKSHVPEHTPAIKSLVSYISFPSDVHKKLDSLTINGKREGLTKFNHLL